MHKFKGGHPSQNGETNIINECIKRLGLAYGLAYEMGAPTKEYCSNIFHLIEKGWTCVYLDSNPQEEGIIKAFVTPENINDLVPKSIDILNLDLDGNDYAVWKAYTGKAKVVIIEINSSLDPDEDHFTPEDGSNFSMMNKLAKSKGYELLCHTGNNIYCLKEYIHLFPDADKTFNRSWLK